MVLVNEDDLSFVPTLKGLLHLLLDLSVEDVICLFSSFLMGIAFGLLWVFLQVCLHFAPSDFIARHVMQVTFVFSFGVDQVLLNLVEQEGLAHSRHTDWYDHVDFWLKLYLLLLGLRFGLALLRPLGLRLLSLGLFGAARRRFAHGLLLGLL